MSTFRREEARDQVIAAAVNEALQRAISEVPQRAALQGGSLPGEPIINGLYNEDDEFILYEIIGVDPLGEKPLGP